MKDKIVVITGGSRGLGKAIAREFISKQAQVVISSRDKKDLESAAREIGARAIQADVTKEADLMKLAREVIAAYGRIDIWINNAGVWLPRASLEETDMKRAHDVMEVNVFGTAYGCRAVLPQMKKQGYGMIINIVSTSALQGRPMSAIYSASKHAAKGLTDSLREEAKDIGVKVMGIYPGGIKTDLFNEAKPEDYDLFMSAESVAQKIVANCSLEDPVPELIIKRPAQVL